MAEACVRLDVFSISMAYLFLLFSSRFMRHKTRLEPFRP